ncbi:HEAT repeat domain-containing protein [Pedosphaera parvula]|uniref:PBS lyase HEAT domain protein repeat-containing protein n=1 Tax=Pedosphaera parvula (strain Ellin514) TaxID=320771 RepID=B9XEY9_PEDPL|nr:HEAT repeat domain-containing protein [Pedosphaera parvula]EEF61487.1 PBS lyase HEAT domain protein repeat-containing protein [Pedosphaera parvula Ellin514]
MRPNRRTLFIALLLLLISIIIWHLLRRSPHEPVYQGKSLTQWLQMGPSTLRDDAFRNMGTNALPFLIHDLHSREIKWKDKCYFFLQRYSVFRTYLRTGYQRHYQAFEALQALGSVGKPAIPAIADCLDNPTTALQAVNVLAYDPRGYTPLLAPEATPALLKALTNNNSSVRTIAANALELSQTQPGVIVPALIRALKDPAPEVRRMAAASFGGIYKKQSDIIVPALIETLDDKHPDVRKSAVWMLGRYGPASKAAIPKLTNLLKDAPSDLEKEIQTALQRIDPARTNQAATK